MSKCLILILNLTLAETLLATNVDVTCPSNATKDLDIDSENKRISAVSFNSNEEYMKFRLLNGLAEGPEILNRIPLECNLDLLNYVGKSQLPMVIVAFKVFSSIIKY
jgi:hypothetical protein